jgi:3-deoxy-D-manno-octulosonic acid kinase
LSVVPDGYQRDDLNGSTVVARREHLAAVRSALASGTLYDYAARHEAAHSLSGRGIAYAVPLPNGERVVVRHNRHGGLLAPLTGDRFLDPTRAPYELAVSLRLLAQGVATPDIVAYVVYPAGPLLRRSDVASSEIRESSDLATVLTSGTDEDRRAALGSTAQLIASLSACGARHHDLNVKNVLLARMTPIAAPVAYVLDVDRVEFGRAGDSRITERNLDRFMRSARKWRELQGARVDEADLVRVAASVRRLVSSRASSGARVSTRS